MIHLALWLISLVVVIVFAIIIFGAGLAFFTTDLGRATLKYTFYTLGLIVVVGIGYMNYQNEQSAERTARNKSAQAQCILQARSSALYLKDQAVSSGSYTVQYSQQLGTQFTSASNNCKNRYPLY